MKMPRFLLAAPKSGSGKTMITCGILRLLQKRGYRPAAFKCGPDYIDPMFHERVLATPSRNLDTWFTDGDTTRYLFGRGCEGCDLAVMEGVMGYYDGLGGIDTTASAYDLACTVDAPAILILDARGTSLSALALIKGFMDFRPDSHIRGVIFNRMNKMMFELLKPVAEKELGITCIGYVPENKDCRLESRHLGLVLPDEVKDLNVMLDQLAESLEETLDVEALLTLAGEAPELSCEMPEALQKILESPEAERVRSIRPKVAISRDDAFCFIYKDNERLLRELGAELLPFSPIRDEKLPEEADGMLLYGGYPELYAKELSGNTSMLQSVRTFCEQGYPYLAECGGFMYLCRSMEDMEEQTYPMAGVIPADAYRTKKLGRFGYITLTPNQEGIFGAAAGSVRAHEFHYFDTTDPGKSWHAAKPLRKRGWDAIHANRNQAAGFPHIYYYSNPAYILEFLCACVKEREEKQAERGGKESC